MEIAVAVARVEGLHGHRNEEVALSGVADALATSGVADAVGLMKRMRNVVGESGLLEDPLGISSQREGGEDGGQESN
jgi:hypothetical protein